MRVLQAACLALVLAFAAKLPAQQKGPLKLVVTIPLPGVEGKWDHFGADVKRNRLFLASEDAALVEVFDLRSNKLIHTITGFKKPHAIFVRDDLNKIFVTDGEASEIKVFDGTSYKLIGHLGLAIDADPILYDPATKYLWVVNGGREAHTPYCLISVVGTTAGKKLADIKLNVNRLESMALERSGERLFVNMAASNEVGVLNRQTHALLGRWPIMYGKENVPMAFDEANHRLFVGTRTPPLIIVLDTSSGRVVASLPIALHTDDLAFDQTRQRIYAACGEGYISVYHEADPNRYQLLENVPTAPGGKTGTFVPGTNRYYAAIPKNGQKPAEVRVYNVAP